GNTARGEFVEVDKPRRLVFTWGWDGNEALPPGLSTVEAELRPEGSGTSLRFVHRDLSPEQAASHAKGWDHYLERLEIAAAGGDPGEDPRGYEPAVDVVTRRVGPRALRAGARGPARTPRGCACRGAPARRARRPCCSAGRAARASPPRRTRHCGALLATPRPRRVH